VEPLRGNVPTRVRRAESGDFDAVILARAGVERLGLADRITEVLSTELLLPAPGQGALGLEARADDDRVRTLLLGLEEPLTRAATDAERGFLQALGGGCQVPVGALARAVPGRDGTLRLEGMVADPDGIELLRGVREGSVREAAALGAGLAHELIGRGAARILAELERAAGRPETR